MQRQPVIDSNGNILMFNGQIYKYLDKPLDLQESDTKFLADKLNACVSAKQIASVFSNIEGPFAFVYWSEQLNLLSYGRDLFGRKSLCVLNDKNSVTPMIISSVADENLELSDLKWSEVDCRGIHCIDYSSRDHYPRKFTYHWNLDEIYPQTSKCLPYPERSQDDEITHISYLARLNGHLESSGELTEQRVNATIDEIEKKFLKAVENRYKFNNKTCLECRRLSEPTSCTHSKVAVAFSGGIDSTLIAMALDKIVATEEAIDLVTVAFKNDSPDRASVGSAYKELKNLCPARNWRLVLCDISIYELQQKRDELIRNLILPCDSVFDDGIGCACWFVGMAKGRAIDNTTSEDWLSDNFDTFLDYDPSLGSHFKLYISPASMLFVGSSIDEQLGGYSSHRAAWTKSGPQGLYEEISFLMRRLSSRNLGRDDRVYCHHGRDLKLPFLDFEFVSFLNELPIGLKMNLSETPDIGPKKILRQLALKWGLLETGRRVKRAMQFGTRIANLENTREKGNDVCIRLRDDNK